MDTYTFDIEEDGTISTSTGVFVSDFAARSDANTSLGKMVNDASCSGPGKLVVHVERDHCVVYHGSVMILTNI